MTSRHPHLAPFPAARKPAARLAAALTALGLLLWPGASLAARKTFSAGSLLIPASIEYQSDAGVLGTYGLAYLILYKNAARIQAGQKPITLYWAVEPTKLSQYRCNTMTNDLPQYSPSYNDNDGCDLAIQSAAGQPVALVSPTGTETAPFNVWNISYGNGTGPIRAATTHSIGASTTVVKYLGGVWIIDATDRQNFLNMLSTAPELVPFLPAGTNPVNIHSARANFTAPIVSVLSAKPLPIALIGSNQTTFLTNVLGNAGLCSVITCGGTFAAGGFTSGVVYDYYANTADLLAPAVGYANGRLNGVVNGRSYSLLWAGDGAAPAAADVSRITYFLNQGNDVFAEYDSIVNLENAADYQTTTGINSFIPNIASYEDCNDTSPGVVFFHGNGPPCLNLAGSNLPWAQTGNFLFDGGQGNYKGYVPDASYVTGVTQICQLSGNGPTVSSSYNLNNDPTKGLVLYMAGHKFDNGRLWGERLILNTLFSKLNPLTGIELSRSEPVGYVSGSGNQMTTRVYQGTYVQMPLPDSNDMVTYNAAKPQLWQFPFTSGHLYEYDVGNISTASQNFSSNTNWDAAYQLPLPANRNIFTVVGGSANLGWKKISVDYTETGASCTDVDGNGRCDLSELLAACNTAGITSGALLPKNSVDQSQYYKLGMFVQQVRGHCSSHTPPITGTPNFVPSDNQCDSSKQTNRAVLGGIDHSSPAVVGPSRYVSDSPWATRPVVAYAAGHDGMLHAFFVSAPQNNWSAEGQSLPPGLKAGQELWAFIPPGQVCGLAANNALVDASINVVDVFGDFPYDVNNDGVIDWTSPAEQPNHVHRWRTVLLAAAGLGGSEMFALDVTNPLKPVLLWHIGGPTEHDGRWDTNGNGVFDAGEVFSTGDASSYALKWYDWDDGNAATTWIPTDYNTTDPTVINAIKTGKYDYRNMGLAYVSPVAKIWGAGGFQSAIFMATSAADYTSGSPTGFRGVEVFAIDVPTGQKIWQWEHLYAGTDATGIDNSIPTGVAIGDIDANGSAERIYVGDMEGHLWELSARDGRNLNYLLASDNTRHSFPLYGTPTMQGTGASGATLALYTVAGGSLGQQPLTTPIGEGRFTQVPSTVAGSFDSSLLVNRLALVLGTMGVDWAIAPYEAGNLLVIPSFPDTGARLQEPVNLNAARDPLKFGILLPTAVWTIPLATGERVYGVPKVANNIIVFNTAFGSFTGDISSTIYDPGNLKIVTAAATTSTPNDAKAMGGALIISGKVVVTTDRSIHQVATPPAALTSGGVAQSPFNRATPAVMKTWEPVVR